MKTPKQHEGHEASNSLDLLVRALGGKYKSYWSVIRKIEGADSGSEWMAVHIGRLNARVDNLTKRIRRIERKRPNAKLRDAGESGVEQH
jgi:hypothetical protein